jgi:hypothetical protein
MRTFIRHPSDIPIDIHPDHRPEDSPEMLINISHGGLSFRSQAGILPGTIVNLTVHIPGGDKQVRARVAWCRDIPEGYDMGVEFLNAADSYTVRMVEQMCHIEHYRRKVKKEQGREIDSEQAAMEWIAQNADDFPNPD